MSYFGFGDQKPTSPGSQNNTARSLFVSEGSTVAESEENQSLVDKGRGFFNSVGDRLKGGVDSVRNAAEEATVTRDRLIIAVVAMLVGVLFFFLSLTLLPTFVFFWIVHYIIELFWLLKNLLLCSLQAQFVLCLLFQPCVGTLLFLPMFSLVIDYGLRLLISLHWF